MGKPQLQVPDFGILDSAALTQYREMRRFCEMASPISSRSYGVLPSGQQVDAWTLTGRGGLVLEVITLGGIVTRMLAPGRN